MKSLFPEMEREIASDRLAEQREQRQRAKEWLAANPGLVKWILDRLEESGPTLDANLFLELSSLRDVREPIIKEALDIFAAMWALWLNGVLWRNEFKNHPSGEACYTYGIKGFHKQP